MKENWIETNKELPIKNKDVLLYGEIVGVVNGLLNNDNKFKVYGMDFFYNIDEITHWMLLPSEPKTKLS